MRGSAYDKKGPDVCERSAAKGQVGNFRPQVSVKIEGNEAKRPVMIKTPRIDTPRTDEAMLIQRLPSDQVRLLRGVVAADFARQLERELAEARPAALEEAAKVCEQQQYRNTPKANAGNQYAATIRALKAAAQVGK